MKTIPMPTKKASGERKKSLLKRINYDPAKAATAWAAITGVWENRTDIDATTVRKEAWINRK